MHDSDNWAQTGAQCKLIFEKMTQKKLAGSAEIPVFIKITTQVKDKITEKEVVDFVGKTKMLKVETIVQQSVQRVS